MASSPARLLPTLCLSACTAAGTPTFSGGGQLVVPDAVPIDWYHDYFTPTFELCGQPQEFITHDPMYQSGDDYGEPVPLVEEDCYDAIRADMKLVEDSFPDDIYDDPETNEVAKASRIAQAGGAGYALLVLSQGTIDDLDHLTDEDDLYYVRPPVVAFWQQLGERVGEDRLQALVYNFTMSAFREVRFANYREVDWSAQVDLETRVADVTFDQSTVVDAAVLVHEATHVWLQVGHAYCPIPEPFFGIDGYVCDQTWFGPWGFAAATAQLQRDAYPWEQEPEYSAYADQSVRSLLTRTESVIIEECCPEYLDDTGGEATGDPLPPPQSHGPACGTTAAP